MKYVIRKRRFSIRGGLIVLDAAGETRFATSKAFLSVRGRVDLEDENGADVAIARAKRFSFGHAYDIERPGAPTATLRSRGWFRRRYELDFGAGHRIEVRPSFFKRRHVFRRDDAEIAVARTPWFATRTLCSVEIAEERDVSLVLAALITILKTIRDKEEEQSQATQQSDSGRR